MNSKRSRIPKSSEGFEEKLKFLSEEKVYEYLETKVRIERWRPFVWIFLTIISSICLSISSYPSKMSSINPYQILFIKSALGLIFTLLYMRLNIVKLRFRYFKIRMLFLLGLSIFICVAGFIFAINFMDFTYCLFIIYKFPFLSMLLAKIWIKEPIELKDFMFLALIQGASSFCLQNDITKPTAFDNSIIQTDLNNYYISPEDDGARNYFIIAILITVVCSMLMAFAYVAAKKLTATKAHPTVFVIVVYFWSLVFGWIFVLTGGGFSQPTIGDWIYLLVESIIEFFGYLTFFKAFFLISVNKIVTLVNIQYLSKLVFTQIVFGALDGNPLYYLGISLCFALILMFILREILTNI
jgi:drug/metabolite transporter (DMT)-like permease